MTRRIVQIEQSVGVKGEPYVLALCDDSTIWVGEDRTGRMRWKYVSIADILTQEMSIRDLETRAQEDHAASLVKDVEKNSLTKLVASEVGRHPEAAE